MLKKLVSFRQADTKRFVFRSIFNHYDKIISSEKYIIGEGNIPIALVAHMDTVFEDDGHDRDTIHHYIKSNTMWAPNGAGFDDKAGVFSILKIIEDGYLPHVIFTTDEEIGCQGSRKLIEDMESHPFEDLKYVISLDRANDNDCVFYDCRNEDFIEYVESFGFVEAFGTSSDIAHICPCWEIAGVNLSIGYKYEHTEEEILNYASMYDTIDKVKAMLDDASNINKAFKYIDWYKDD
jgi:putative aminopeptidase FrvX